MQRFAARQHLHKPGNTPRAGFGAFHGLEASRVKARMLIDQAKHAVAPLGARAEPIRALADFICDRRS